MAPVTWKNVQQSDTAGELGVMARAAQGIGRGIAGVGTAIKGYAEGQTELDTNRLVAEVNAAGSAEERDEIMSVATAKGGFANLALGSEAAIAGDNQDMLVARQGFAEEAAARAETNQAWTEKNRITQAGFDLENQGFKRQNSKILMENYVTKQQELDQDARNTSWVTTGKYGKAARTRAEIMADFNGAPSGAGSSVGSSQNPVAQVPASITGEAPVNQVAPQTNAIDAAAEQIQAQQGVSEQTVSSAAEAIGGYAPPKIASLQAIGGLKKSADQDLAMTRRRGQLSEVGQYALDSVIGEGNLDLTNALTLNSVYKKMLPHFKGTGLSSAETKQAAKDFLSNDLSLDVAGLGSEKLSRSLTRIKADVEMGNIPEDQLLQLDLHATAKATGLSYDWLSNLHGERIVPLVREKITDQMTAMDTQLKEENEVRIRAAADVVKDLQANDPNNREAISVAMTAFEEAKAALGLIEMKPDGQEIYTTAGMANYVKLLKKAEVDYKGLTPPSVAKIEADIDKVYNITNTRNQISQNGSDNRELEGLVKDHNNKKNDTLKANEKKFSAISVQEKIGEGVSTQIIKELHEAVMNKLPGFESANLGWVAFEAMEEVVGSNKHLFGLAPTGLQSKDAMGEVMHESTGALILKVLKRTQELGAQYSNSRKDHDLHSGYASQAVSNALFSFPEDKMDIILQTIADDEAAINKMTGPESFFMNHVSDVFGDQGSVIAGIIPQLLMPEGK